MQRVDNLESSRHYSVEQPRSEDHLAMEAGDSTSRQVQAVIVVHGMGQQTPFQALDQVVEGLLREETIIRQRDAAKSQEGRVVARTVLLGNKLLRRLEVRLTSSSGLEREVHLYEAYWAWLTEGQVTLRNVLAFLWRAGVGGIVKGMHPFKRWLFGRLHTFEPPVRTVAYLLVALATVASLAGINLAIVTVAAARSPLNNNLPGWLSDGLFADLTTTFNLLLAVAGIFALILVLARVSRRLRLAQLIRSGLAMLSFAGFVLLLVVVVMAGVGVAMLLWVHGTCKGQPSAGGRQIWREITRPGLVDAFNDRFATFLLYLLMAFAAFVALRWAWRFGRRVVYGLRKNQPRRWRTAAAVLALGMLTAAVVGEAYFFLGRICSAESGDPLQTVRRAVSWPLLIVISAGVRQLLIQYVGDVAAYVNPNTLNRFAELRSRIKETVCEIVGKVYGAPAISESGFLYESVSIVGHSLGSVVAYDCLNKLLNDDDLVRPGSGDEVVKEARKDDRSAGRPIFVDAAGRTRLLLTFGSPLDKIAFLFSIQGDKASPAREALASSVQPLIADSAKRRFDWINVWAPADIISGSLDFYDLPPEEEPVAGSAFRPVENLRDGDATTLLGAHVEYWENRAVFEVLHKQLTESP